MSRFDTYKNGFAKAQLTRSDSGVLEVPSTPMVRSWSSTAIPTSSSSNCSTRSARTPTIGS